jgi:hypothetical protein
MVETVILLDVEHQACVIVTNQLKVLAFFQCAAGPDCGGPVVYCLELCLAVVSLVNRFELWP